MIIFLSYLSDNQGVAGGFTAYGPYATVEDAIEDNEGVKGFMLHLNSKNLTLDYA